eukprot:gene37714-46532_t
MVSWKRNFKIVSVCRTLKDIDISNVIPDSTYHTKTKRSEGQTKSDAATKKSNSKSTKCGDAEESFVEEWKAQQEANFGKEMIPPPPMASDAPNWAQPDLGFRVLEDENSPKSPAPSGSPLSQTMRKFKSLNVFPTVDEHAELVTPTQ